MDNRFHDTFDDEWLEEERRKFHAKGIDALDDNGVVNLTETILSEIKTEMRHAIRAYQMSPDRDDVKIAIKNINDLLDSDYFYILTMGHGDGLRDEFRRRCNLSGCARENVEVASR